MEFSTLIHKTKEVIALYSQVETRPWGVEAMCVELCGEIGTLAESIMIKEGYRPIRDGTEIDLDDDIVDIVFMLIRIADYYNINLEESYRKMLDETRQKIERRIASRHE